MYEKFTGKIAPSNEVPEQVKNSDRLKWKA